MILETKSKIALYHPFICSELKNRHLFVVVSALCTTVTIFCKYISIKQPIRSLKMRRPSSENHGNVAETNVKSGWAAFLLKHRRTLQDLESKIETEDFPSLCDSPSQSLLIKNEETLQKPFSSVVASASTPSSANISYEDPQNRVLVFAKAWPNASHNSKTDASVEANEKLGHHHPSVDESLVEDVLVGAEEAQSLLEAILVPANEATQGNKLQTIRGSDTASINLQSVSVAEKANPNPITDDSFKKGSTEHKSESSSSLLADIAKSLPMEPEFDLDEGDIYVVHRRNAMKMARSAFRHSKAANNAYERGDHLSAHICSLKAQEERSAAEKLNSQAALEILSVRNNEYDSWTLDLHGLHAAEAVQALQERLRMVETLISSISLAPQNGLSKESSTLHSSSVQTTHLRMKNFGSQYSYPRQRPRILQVITGKGNHSHGAAALPSVIRNFLTENEYHFAETRPGVIMIWPKFRRQ